MSPTLELHPTTRHYRSFEAATWSCARLTAEAVWRAGLCTVRAHLLGEGDQLAKVVINGEVVTSPETLPRTDGREGFLAWFDRIRTTYGGLSTLFYARDLARYDRKLYEMLLSSTGPVFDTFGLSRRGVDLELFCGEYRATPGGIHREFCANNHFVLSGRKLMHFWIGDGWIPNTVDRERYDGPVGSADEQYMPSLTVDSVIRHGTTLAAEAGEMFSWQNGVWHVGETEGLALAVNIARYMSSFDADEENVFLQATEEGEVTRRWLAVYRSFLEDDVDEVTALAVASAFGIPGAAPSSVCTEAPQWVARATHAPLLWCAIDGEVAVATHGQAQLFPQSCLPWLTRLGRRAVGEGHAVGVEEKIGALAAWLVTHSAVRAV